MLQFDEYKVKLNNLAPTLEELGKALDLESAERELDMLQAESAADGFWNNLEKAQKVQQRIKNLQDKVDKQNKRRREWDDLMALCEMGNEFEDESLLPELEEGFAQLERDMEEARLQTLLTGEYDSSNVILTIHPGAGGTEAQDWAQMLYRMYTRWTERHGFTYQIMDYQEGDEAGIKSATIMVEGENAYGYLRGEHGVHRLVRVSPFDANARRQTSFASVEVMPDLPEDVEVDIRPEDIEMQVYRASGAGVEGQNGAVAVVLPGEQRGHPGFLHLFLQRLEAGLQLVQQLRVVRLLAHLAQGRQVLPLGHQLVLAGDLVLQLLEALLHLLGPLQIVPEAVLGGLVLQLLGLRPGAVHIQRGGELVQLGTQVPELLLIFVVFDQSHEISPLPQISLAIVLYRRDLDL